MEATSSETYCGRGNEGNDSKQQRGSMFLTRAAAIKAMRANLSDDMWTQGFREATGSNMESTTAEMRVQEPVRRYGSSIGVSNETKILGDNLLIWSRAFASCMNISAQGSKAAHVTRSAPSVKPEARTACARQWNRFPAIKRTKLVHGDKQASLVDKYGGGPMGIRAWKKVKRWMADLGSWAQKGPARCIAIIGATRNLRKFIDGSGKAVRELIEDVEETERSTLVGEIQRGIECGMAGMTFDPGKAVEIVDPLAEAAKWKGHTAAKESSRQWIREGLGGGELHKKANAENALPPLRLHIKSQDGSRYISDPTEIAARHTKPWRTEWAVDDSDIWKKELETLTSVRGSLLEDAAKWVEGFELTPQSIRKACGTFSKKTSIAGDDLPMWILAGMPDAALWDLATLLSMALANLTLPEQCMVNIMSLLGKRKGGSRTVATMASFYRILCRIVGHVITEWDQTVAGPWGSAIKGSSALRAHLARAVGVELDTAEGRHVMHFLWDGRNYMTVSG